VRAKIVALKPDERSPEVVLHQTLNKVDKLKAVVVVMVTHDDKYIIDTSSMLKSEVCMAAMTLHQNAIDSAMED
jgi:hypothetical protein